MKIHPSLNGKLSILAQGRVSRPRVSGDGSTIVWNQLVGENQEVMGYQDGHVDSLSSDPRFDYDADLSDDGRTIAWSRLMLDEQGEPEKWDVVLWQDGEERVLSDRPGNELSVTVSGDGKTIAWDDDVDGRFGGDNIIQWSEDRGIEQITDGTETDLLPKLSEDGSRLAFQRNSSDGRHLWLRDQNGTVKELFRGEGKVLMADISEDGRDFVWTQKRGRELDLYRYNEPTNELEHPSALAGVEEKHPCLTEDGTIVWAARDRRPEGTGQTQLFLQPKGGDSIQITADAQGNSLDPHVSDDGNVLSWTWVDNKDASNRRIYRLEI